MRWRNKWGGKGDGSKLGLSDPNLGDWEVGESEQ